jgi:hypothetical protein
MGPEEAEARVIAALSLALASTHGVGTVPTARLLEVAQASFALADHEALLALDRLAERGRLMERHGVWSLRAIPPPLGH